MKCGVQESINHDVLLAEKYDTVDCKLHEQGKCRIPVKGDGHCLPRAVFRGAKLMDHAKQHITYKSLFQASMERIKMNIDHYVPFLAESKESALEQLDKYFCSKKYSLPSNVLDACINALASEASCRIKVHYLADSGNLQNHIIEPLEHGDTGLVSSIELVFLNGHYDLVVDYCSISTTRSQSQQPIECIILGDSPCKKRRESYVKAEVKEEELPYVGMEGDYGIYTMAAIDDTFDDTLDPSADSLSISSGSGEEEVADAPLKFCGKRKYIDSEAFKGVNKMNVMSVPQDIDGLCVFEVPIPQESTLKPFKGARPWGRAQSSKISTFDKGPRLLFNCRGSFVCPNLKCSNLAEFGVNRSDFVCKESVEVCKVCGTKAEFLSCECRLIIEKDLDSQVATVYHYGNHSCLPVVRGRPKPATLIKAMEENPHVSRETIIRQAVQSTLQQKTYKEAVETAKLYTDTRFVDNAKKKIKQKNRPEGSQSFSAVKLVQDTYKGEDPFLVYDFSDGYDGSLPFVMKSSKLKVKIMRDLDKDGSHPLSSETVHLDVLHSRCKGWKTYTLSYYDKFLCELVRLAVMETISEDWKGCEMFFKVINRMIKDHVLNDGKDASNVSFNPYHLKDDEHGGNKIGMARVFGENFVKDRTSSCLYHLDQSVRNHKKLVSKEQQVEYQLLWGELKDAVTKQAYNLAYRGLKKVIEIQVESSRKPLSDALRFWHDCRFRWATSWRFSFQGIPLSSLAEPSQASMKAGSQKNVSLVDGIFADIVDSARLEGKWGNRQSGEPSQGSGPSALELLQRDKNRQLKRSAHFINEAAKIDFTSTPKTDEECIDVAKTLDASRSHRPDKKAQSVKRPYSAIHESSSSSESSSNPRPAVAKVRPRSIECATFQKLLKKSLSESGNMKILFIKKSASDVVICLQHSKTKCNLQFGKEFSCDCFHQQRARKASCIHIIWCLLKVFKLEQNDRLLAQLSIGSEILDDLLKRVGISFDFETFLSLDVRCLQKCGKRFFSAYFHFMLRSLSLANY